MLLYAYLKDRCKDSAERGQKIDQVRLTPGGIDTIKEAMKVDQAQYDKYESEVQPLKDARKGTKYDHWETINLGEGFKMESEVGGEREEFDNLIAKVESKYSSSLAIYNQLRIAVSHDKYERERAAREEQKAAARREAENEFNSILSMTRSRASY